MPAFFKSSLGIKQDCFPIVSTCHRVHPSFFEPQLKWMYHHMSMIWVIKKIITCSKIPQFTIKDISWHGLSHEQEKIKRMIPLHVLSILEDYCYIFLNERFSIGAHVFSIAISTKYIWLCHTIIANYTISSQIQSWRITIFNTTSWFFTISSSLIMYKGFIEL